MLDKYNDLIKICIPLDNEIGDGPQSETLWCIKRGIGKAEINNIPCFCDIGFRDLIRYEMIDGINIYIETIVSINKSIHISWEVDEEVDEESIKNRWKEICEYLYGLELDFEPWSPGFFVISFPIEDDTEDILDIVEGCPVKLTPYL